MAKKGKTESVLARETRLKAEAEAVAAVKAEALRVAAAAREAEAAELAAVEKRRAEKAAKMKKVKRPRFVRPPVEKRPEPKKLPPLPERSTKTRGKLMTKNLALPPKEDDTLTGGRTRP